MNHRVCYSQQETQLSLTNRAMHNFVQTWLTSYKHTSSHIGHHAEFGRSALKDVGINTGEPQNSGALELRTLGISTLCLTPRYTHPHMCYHVKFGSSATVPRY